MVTASVLLLAVYVYTIVDVSLRDRSRVRRLPKPAWLLVVILLPLIGSALWFTLGRGRGAAPAAPVASEPPASATQAAPATETQAQLDALEREIEEAGRAERIRRLEQELERRRGSGETAQP
ncbi:MAG: PLDc N-terminal domain-containing protein [Leifsonia sp.]